MRQKVFTVTDRFEIVRRGTVIVGEPPAAVPDIIDGSPIVLVTPEGREIVTEIGGTDWPTTVSGQRRIAFLIKKIDKKEIPVGTEVFRET